MAVGLALAQESIDQAKQDCAEVATVMVIKNGDDKVYTYDDASHALVAKNPTASKRGCNSSLASTALSNVTAQSGIATPQASPNANKSVPAKVLTRSSPSYSDVGFPIDLTGQATVSGSYPMAFGAQVTAWYAAEAIGPAAHSVIRTGSGPGCNYNKNAYFPSELYHYSCPSHKLNSNYHLVGTMSWPITNGETYLTYDVTYKISA